MTFRKWLIGSALMLLGLLGWVHSLQAQVGYDHSWFSVGSSAVSRAGEYTLHGVIGQANAGERRTGEYTLASGVLVVSTDAPPAPKSSTLFLPHLSR